MDDERLDGLIFCDKCGNETKLAETVAVVMFSVAFPKVSKQAKLVCMGCAEATTEFLERE